MKPEDEWTIVYSTENGKRPVEEFLLELDQKARAHLLEEIKFLREHNIQLREPHVKNIGDKLWEFRSKYHTNAYRILYATFTGKQIVLLHAFVKKTQKTLPRERDMALRRLAHYEATHGGTK